MSTSNIRNFSIIAHIDHGKSTLADRIIELTGAIDSRELTDQHLDTMDLERERGITIKAQAIRLMYHAENGGIFQINLIDTPGHVDFNYEVSRVLAACEGAILLVDASQGIQAQTLANVYLALENDVEIIPVINKMDLESANPTAVLKELNQYFGFREEESFLVSAKTGEGVSELIDAIVERVPSPKNQLDDSLRALIFDSKYDSYKGVIAYVKIVSGNITRDDKITFLSSKVDTDVLGTGFFSPELQEIDVLNAGEVGFIATGVKDIKSVKVGDTITKKGQKVDPLPGYRPAQPMVFTGMYPTDADDYPLLKDALDRLKLNDASLLYEPESSSALGFGFRCGFLGLLHMEIIQERLEREFDVNLIVTAPSVKYKVIKIDGNEIYVDNPYYFPPSQLINEIVEPWVGVTIFSPSKYIGKIMDLVTSRRGEYKKMEFLQSEKTSIHADSGNSRVSLVYHMPLSEIIVDFHDRLKSVSQGFASMDYEMIDGRPSNLVKLDILVNHEPVDALSIITHRDEAASRGRILASKLKDLIPRQMFDVSIQAAIGAKIVARTNVKALRKNVTAKCYGGDITRKRKLLEQQKIGKKRRMKMVGSVEVPQEAFMAVLSLEP